MATKLKAGPAMPFAQWKRQFGASWGRKAKQDEAPFVTEGTHNLTPMFVPTRTDGNDFFEITSRKDFLDREIGGWLKWHSYRGLSILFGVATLFLFTVHPMLAAVGGLATGWAFGWYYRQSRSIDILKKRDLMESV